MPGRYDKLADPPPSFDELYFLLICASPTQRQRMEDPDTTETLRRKAVRNLLTLARRAVANANEVEPRPPEGYSRDRAMPLELRNFLEEAALRIFLADDPFAELGRFLGQLPRGRGRPVADNERRDELIAADVAELVHHGMTIDAACTAVEKEAPVGFERVREIYLARRHDLAVRAELGLRLLFPAKGDKSAWAAAVMAREGK